MLSHKLIERCQPYGNIMCKNKVNTIFKNKITRGLLNFILNIYNLKIENKLITTNIVHTVELKIDSMWLN